MQNQNEKNVLGQPLSPCCTKPLTGFYRTGTCSVGPDDLGVHAVCIEATEDFLTFSKEAGNDLSTPVPEYAFPGLKPGDRWCLCAPRWQEAFEAGCAPMVLLASTHEAALEHCFLEDLKNHALDTDLDEAWQSLQHHTK
jgi:uncharacterized protein (DUF2237 family)